MDFQDIQVGLVSLDFRGIQVYQDILVSLDFLDILVLVFLVILVILVHQEQVGFLDTREQVEFLVSLDILEHRE